MSDDWVDAEVQVQGDSLVVKDKKTGNCLVAEVRSLFNEHYTDNPYERLESIFGEEVFDE